MSDRDDVDLGVTLDKWGFRYRGSPGDLGEAKPASWRQVWRQVNRHLMRLVSGVPRFLAEAVEGVTRIARSTVSRAAAVEAAHAEAELWEEAHRRLPAAVGVSERRQREAGRRLAALLARYRASGHVAEVVADADGRPMVVIVRRSPTPSPSSSAPEDATLSSRETRPEEQAHAASIRRADPGP